VETIEWRLEQKFKIRARAVLAPKGNSALPDASTVATTGSGIVVETISSTSAESSTAAVANAAAYRNTAP
jgi:hypothetical protein